MSDGNFVVLSKAHENTPVQIKNSKYDCFQSLSYLGPKYDGVEGKKIHVLDLRLPYLTKYNPTKKDYRIWGPELPRSNSNIPQVRCP